MSTIKTFTEQMHDLSARTNRLIGELDAHDRLLKMIIAELDGIKRTPVEQMTEAEAKHYALALADLRRDDERTAANYTDEDDLPF